MANRILPTLPEDDQCDCVGALGAMLLTLDNRENLSIWQQRHYSECLRSYELVCYKYRWRFNVVVLEFVHNKRIHFQRKLLHQLQILAQRQEGHIAKNNAGLIHELNDYLPN